MMKKILITGCSKGIGKFLSQQYSKNGFKVLGVSRTTPEYDIANFKHYSCDVSDERAVVETVKQIREDEPEGIDILINNAGMASMNHTILTPASTVHKLFGTNVYGTFFFSREIAKLMKKNGKGRIVNFSTVAVPLNLEGEAIYAASKSAVETLTIIMAKELATFGITVNAIGPTPIETDLIKNVPKNKLDDLLRSQAIKRFGNFDDVKNVIDFYTSDKSEFITGQIMYLGGVR
ncbi:SDR family NAD(P)-dependent oxidoreductase [Bdellovibrio sp. HCB185ZH]|uniref:SDR family NAD(P)-dependent oxidoreductase n=1 Tax=Bdellovibrio sp. HCB185ZH TaxID=3394235 RepID=UPI0039A53D81